MASAVLIAGQGIARSGQLCAQTGGGLRCQPHHGNENAPPENSIARRRGAAVSLERTTVVLSERTGPSSEATTDQARSARSAGSRSGARQDNEENADRAHDGALGDCFRATHGSGECTRF